MRYTEAKLTPYGNELLRDINKDICDFKDNYDGEEKEPVYIGTLVPNLLVNGTSGIAVGMASNIPPHNLSEVYDALIAIIDKTIDGEEATLDDVLEYIQGPDFPTGSVLINKHVLKNTYETGRSSKGSSVILRANYKIEDNKIIFTDIPFKEDKAKICESIADLVKDKIIEDIKNIEDHSNKEGMAIEITVKAGANIDVVLNNLFKKTNLQSSVSFNMNVLVEGQPIVLNLLTILNQFLAHSANVIIRRSQFNYNKAEKRLNIVNGTIKAKSMIKDITSAVEEAESDEDLLNSLIDLGFNREQAESISSTQLKSLVRANITKLEEEKQILENSITHLSSILNDQTVLLDTMKEEFSALKTKLGDERRTTITELDASFTTEDLIVEKEVIVTMTTDHCIKLMSPDAYKVQARGGKGVKASDDEKPVECIINTSNKSTLLFLTNKGRCYKLKAYIIPESSKASKAKSINNYITLSEGEEVISLIALEDAKDKSLLFVTAQGIAKRLLISQLSESYQSTKVMSFKEDDMLVSALLVEDSSEIIISTASGQTLRIDLSDIRPMGRGAAGVRGIKLKENDYVIDTSIIKDNSKLLTVSSNGFAKRTEITEYPKYNRGSRGVVGYKVNAKSGIVSAVHDVCDEDELLIATSSGKMIKIKADSISINGRATTGVKIVNLENSEYVTAVSVVKGE